MTTYSLLITFIHVAQQLLSDWMNSKLKLASDQEDGTEDPVPRSLSPWEPPIGFQKYEKFDGETTLFDFKQAVQP